MTTTHTIALPNGKSWTVDSHKDKARLRIGRGHYRFEIQALNVEMMSQYIKRRWAGGLGDLMTSPRGVVDEFVKASNAYIATEPVAPELLSGGLQLRIPPKRRLRHKRNEAVATETVAAIIPVANATAASWAQPLGILPTVAEETGSDRAIPRLCEQVRAWDAHHQPTSRLLVSRLQGSNRTAYFMGQPDLVFIGIGEAFAGTVKVCFVELKTSKGLDAAQKGWQVRVADMLGSGSHLLARLNDLNNKGLQYVLDWMQTPSQPLLREQATTPATTATAAADVFAAAMTAAFDGASPEQRGAILASMARGIEARN